MATHTYPFAWIETGRAVGYDLARFDLSFDAGRAPESVIEGFRLGKAKYARPQPSTRFERKWVQIRLNAFLRDRIVDVHVTPEFLRIIDVTECPVLRVALSHGALVGTDWSVDRLNNDGAYAQSNLAVISTQANAAKSGRSFAEVLELSRQSETVDLLSPVQWLRLACLMLGPCFAETPKFAPTMPLVTPIPKYTVRLAMQQIQYALTLHAKTQSGKNVLIKQFNTAVSRDDSKSRFTLLAEGVHQGLKISTPCWDVWLIPSVMDMLVSWRQTMNLEDWARVGEVSRRIVGARTVGASRLSPWMLQTKGYR